MIKVILAILGLVVVCLNPILSGMFVTSCVTYWLIQRFSNERPVGRKKEPAPKTKPNEFKRFTTYKEMSEKMTKGMFKEGFEKDPEWQRQTAELRKIMDENRRKEQAKRDAGDWS